jgi:hypothetical protein
VTWDTPRCVARSPSHHSYGAGAGRLWGNRATRAVDAQDLQQVADRVRVKTELRLGGRKPSAWRCRTLSSGLDALACSLYFVVAPASARGFDEDVWLVSLGRLHGISYGLWGVAVANANSYPGLYRAADGPSGRRSVLSERWALSPRWSRRSLACISPARRCWAISFACPALGAMRWESSSFLSHETGMGVSRHRRTRA